MLEEVRDLAGNGYKEVVLTGIHLSSYGIDFDGQRHLLDLIKEVHQSRRDRTDPSRFSWSRGLLRKSLQKSFTRCRKCVRIFIFSSKADVTRR